MSSDAPPSEGANTPAADAAAITTGGQVVVIAGPPASGKGTQCKLLAAELGMVHVSTGDVFRDAVGQGTEPPL
jgi:adenylate kinase